MKTIHWILLAGLGYYLYSQKSKAAHSQIIDPITGLPKATGLYEPTQPAPGTWIFDQKTGLISVQGQKIDPGPQPIADSRAEPFPVTDLYSDYGRSYLPR